MVRLPFVAPCAKWSRQCAVAISCSVRRGRTAALPRSMRRPPRVDKDPIAHVVAHAAQRALARCTHRRVRPMPTSPHSLSLR
eukprot:4915970-Prymnesium_polylepis.1